MIPKFFQKTCYQTYQQTDVDSDGDSRPWLVLIHGLGMQQEMWQWQIPALSEHYRIVTYDLYDHGKSGTGDETASLTQFSVQLTALLDHLKIERCAVIGFSLGGMIVRRFALDAPRRLTALAILHSPHLRTKQAHDLIKARVEQVKLLGPIATVDAALERWFGDDYRAKNPAIMDLIRLWILKNSDRDKYAENYQLLVDGVFEICPMPKIITAPVLVVTGDEDYGNNKDMAQKIANDFPNGEAVILPALRHMALAENPDLMNQTLLNFLKSALPQNDRKA